MAEGPWGCQVLMSRPLRPEYVLLPCFRTNYQSGCVVRGNIVLFITLISRYWQISYSCMPTILTESTSCSSPTKWSTPHFSALPVRQRFPFGSFITFEAFCVLLWRDIHAILKNLTYRRVLRLIFCIVFMVEDFERSAPNLSFTETAAAEHSVLYVQHHLPTPEWYFVCPRRSRKARCRNILHSQGG